MYDTPHLLTHYFYKNILQGKSYMNNIKIHNKKLIPC